MSTKRILYISAFSLLFIAIAVGVMLITSRADREIEPVALPVTTETTDAPAKNEPDALNRVEVTTGTVQAVILTLNRPHTYNREIRIESYWENGQAEYDISVAVIGNKTSLRVQPSSGGEKRIIITPDKLYIWYAGDCTPYIGLIDPSGDELKQTDEWQMLFSYEDILDMEISDIIDAGYTEYGDEDCIFVEYRSPLLGYIRRYYVSIALGLVTGAEEHDENGSLVYAMTSGECRINAPDSEAFILQDGTDVGTDG